MKRRWTLLIIYLILVIVCAVIIYIVPPVVGLFETTYIAQHGSLEVSNEVDALIIRDDTVYVSKKPGTINRLAEEGSLVRTGSKLLELTGDGNEEKNDKYEEALDRLGKSVGKSEGGCQKAGYVTYLIDGYESVLTPEKLDSIKYKRYMSVSNDDILEMPSKRCAKGDPISRITSNGAWWLLFYVDNSCASRYVEGETVDIEIGDETVEGRIRTVKTKKERTKVIIMSKMKCKSYLTSRKTNVKVITSNADGIILEKDSLVTIGDTLGVIVLDKIGDKYFRPIRIKADDGKRVAVYEDIYMDDNNEFVETLDNYDEILRNPTDKDIEEITAAMKARSKE